MLSSYIGEQAEKFEEESQCRLRSQGRIQRCIFETNIGAQRFRRQCAHITDRAT